MHTKAPHTLLLLANNPLVTSSSPPCFIKLSRQHRICSSSCKAITEGQETSPSHLLNAHSDPCRAPAKRTRGRASHQAARASSLPPARNGTETLVYKSRVKLKRRSCHSVEARSLGRLPKSLVCCPTSASWLHAVLLLLPPKGDPDITLLLSFTPNLEDPPVQTQHQTQPHMPPFPYVVMPTAVLA